MKPLLKEILLRLVIIAILSLIFFLSNAFLSVGTAATIDLRSIFSTGLELIDSNNLPKAEKRFLKITKSDAGHYPSYYNLCLIALRQGDTEKALRYLETAVTLNPYDLRLTTMQSIAKLRHSDTAGAKQDIAAIITKDPASISARKKLAIILLQENNAKEAMLELTTIRNLAPSDTESAFIFTHDLTRKDDLSLILDPLLKTILDREVQELTPEQEFENPEISKQIAARQKIEQAYAPINAVQSTRTANRPFQWTGTLTENIELNDRSPKTSNPINGLNTTTNITVEGKTTRDINLKTEFEGLFNRWDNSQLDFYKINANKSGDFEVDAGKFSAKYFPTLVTHPTVENGIRMWKKIPLPEFKPQKIKPINETAGTPVNLARLFSEKLIDNRQFRDIEFTAAFGKTLSSVNVGERKESNENTDETSGDFEQWTRAYRINSNVNDALTIGASYALTEDYVNSTVVDSSTTPITSETVGLDAGINLLDNNLRLSGELAQGDYDEDRRDDTAKSLRDHAWLFKSEYIASDTLSFAYEQKSIGRHFRVEGASQTQDKVTHTIDAVYKPEAPKIWTIQSQTFELIPEVEGEDGNGDVKKYYRTFQSITDCKFPDDAKFIFDYKYYREDDKCGCTDYTTLTFKNGLEWTYKPFQTTLKPSYTLEQKNDLTSAPTNETRKEYVLSLENTLIKDLKITYSFEREIKDYTGTTEKSYAQNIQGIDADYAIIPSRLDLKTKLSQDFKSPTDTNKTDIVTAMFELDYTSKTGDDQILLKFERKNYVYIPWTDSSAYKQNYWNLKYVRKF